MPEARNMKIAVNPTGNIEGLQILRAVAALMVVLHHARLSVPGSGGWPSFGEAGVDIFFVISGFVMAYTTRSIGGALSMKSRLHEVGVFLRKRVVRVVPLYWLALLWTSRRDLVQRHVSADLVKDALFIPHPNSVFHDWLAPTLQQGWTLNYEAFFYVLFALSLLCGSARMAAVLSALVALALAGELSARAGWPVDADSAAGIARRFYGDNIILEFGYGIVVERIVSARWLRDLPRWGAAAAALAGFALLALGHGRGTRGILEGLPAALIVWSGVRLWAGKRAPTLELLGAASYSIYLFHWASFGAVKPLAKAVESLQDGPAKVTLLMAAHFFVAVLAGLVIHFAIEKPLVRWATARFGSKSAKIPAVLSA
jgi:exopolysaccharide production protein ExoZ